MAPYALPSILGLYQCLWLQEAELNTKSSSQLPLGWGFYAKHDYSFCKKSDPPDAKKYLGKIIIDTIPWSSFSVVKYHMLNFANCIYRRQKLIITYSIKHHYRGCELIILDQCWMYPGFIPVVRFSADTETEYTPQNQWSLLSWQQNGYILASSWLHPGCMLDVSRMHPGK